jgi:hypothetical protein
LVDPGFSTSPDRAETLYVDLIINALILSVKGPILTILTTDGIFLKLCEHGIYKLKG